MVLAAGPLGLRRGLGHFGEAGLTNSQLETLDTAG